VWVENRLPTVAGLLGCPVGCWVAGNLVAGLLGCWVAGLLATWLLGCWVAGLLGFID